MRSETGFDSENGDFMASRQSLDPLEVWRINGKMCIAHREDPIYITKEQAMAFFNLTDK